MEEPEAVNQTEIMAYYDYKGAGGRLKYYLRYLFSWSLQSLARLSPHPGFAAALHRLRGVKMGNHVYIGPGVSLDELYPGRLIIEDYVSIGTGSMIFCHSNPTCSIELKRRFYPRKVQTTTIKRGAWIAPGSIVLAGVTIGENSIVGAGSVVTRDVEPYTVVGGNPAKVIKFLLPVAERPVAQPPAVPGTEMRASV